MALPRIEDVVPAETLAAAKADVAASVEETYQPLLDELVSRFNYRDLQAKVAANVSLSLVEKGEGTVIFSEVSVGVSFTPETTYDMVERAHREVIRVAFGGLVDKGTVTE